MKQGLIRDGPDLFISQVMQTMVTVKGEFTWQK